MHQFVHVSHVFPLFLYAYSAASTAASYTGRQDDALRRTEGRLEAEHKKVTRRCPQLEAQLAVARQEASVLRADREVLEKRVADATQQRDDARGRLRTFESVYCVDLGRFKKIDTDGLRQQLEGVIKERDQVQTSYLAAESARRDLAAARQQLEQQHAKTTERLKGAISRINELQSSELPSQRDGQLLESRNTILRLEQEAAQLKANAIIAKPRRAASETAARSPSLSPVAMGPLAPQEPPLSTHDAARDMMLRGAPPAVPPLPLPSLLTLNTDTLGSDRLRPPPAACGRNKRARPNEEEGKQGEGGGVADAAHASNGVEHVSPTRTRRKNAFAGGDAIVPSVPSEPSPHPHVEERLAGRPSRSGTALRRGAGRADG
ncbi:unnamed protein product [Vitrella brassicaformis CCMP3155]|uniref:Lebercilin domain-containing protein n=1 Tax=Vitrella brassicaformis (strain CCMP3155) TaxID=1169540 RepID=A0A0G4H399_VITBC|nr:unnamed protein product [Vitrella brassicaformis CCMP3155]|eukprot:CEM38185.1 unnamed protein product [Vitrella brassicaformis CCMP3155]